MNLFEVLKKDTTIFPDRVVLEDEIHGEYTFKDIEENSSRIYKYLTTLNIGKEDIVAIRMKRSAKIFITILGVWKAGASFVVIGERSPKEYVERVLSDTKPTLIFDDSQYDLAMSCDILEGYKKKIHKI